MGSPEDQGNGLGDVSEGQSQSTRKRNSALIPCKHGSGAVVSGNRCSAKETRVRSTGKHKDMRPTTGKHTGEPSTLKAPSVMTREDPEPKWIRMMEAEQDTAEAPATESGEATGTAQLPVTPTAAQVKERESYAGLKVMVSQMVTNAMDEFKPEILQTLGTARHDSREERREPTEPPGLREMSDNGQDHLGQDQWDGYGSD